MASANAVTTKEQPIGGAGRWFPVLLFLLFTAIVWAGGKVAGEPSWLKTAAEFASAVRDKGVDILSGLSPTSDPRLFFSSLLMILGLPAGVTLVLVRLISIAIGATTIYLLASHGSQRGQFDRAAAWFLALSPLWVAGAVNGDPAICLGLMFLVLTRYRLNFWWRIIPVGWACGWNSWAWVSVLLLLLDKSNRRENERGGWLGPIALALPLVWILNPLALANPAGWWEGMAHQITSDGFWSSGAHVGTGLGLWPLLDSIHYPGALFLLIAAFYWPERLRRFEVPALVFFLMLALGARSAYASPALLLILLPWAAGEIGKGWNALRHRLVVKIGPVIMTLLLLLAVLPLGLGSLAINPPPLQVMDQQQEAAAWLEANLPAGSLVVHDMSFSPPTTSSLNWLALPFHAITPRIHRAAYWRGWFSMASAFVINERMVIRCLKEPEKSREMLNFFQDLTTETVGDVAFGDEVERRSRVLLVTPSPTSELGQDWRMRLTRGPGGGLDGNWLATLGLAYLEMGKPELCAELLEEALSAGYQNMGIYINLANTFMAIGHTNEAGRVLDEGILKYPDSPEMLYNLAVVLVKGERWNRAVQTLARLQKHWSNSAEVALMLGLSMINDEHPQNAAVQLRKALRLNPTPAEKAEIERLLRHLENAQL